MQRRHRGHCIGSVDAVNALDKRPERKSMAARMLTESTSPINWSRHFPSAGRLCKRTDTAYPFLARNIQFQHCRETHEKSSSLPSMTLAIRASRVGQTATSHSHGARKNCRLSTLFRQWDLRLITKFCRQEMSEDPTSFCKIPFPCCVHMHQQARTTTPYSQ